MIDEKASDLGRLIGQSSEYQAVKRANDALSGDREAGPLLKQLEQLQIRAQEMIDRGERPTEAMEHELDDLLGRVQSNAVYMRVAKAQEEFDKLMVRVNERIFEGMQRGATSSIITLG